MHPVAGAGFGEARAARRAALAERMILRILAHPEAKHDAFLRMLGAARNEQEEPHVGGLAIGIGCGAGLPRNLACLRQREREHPFFSFFGFQLPDCIAQRIHPCDDAAPEGRCGARATDIEWRLQEFCHCGRHRRMDEARLR